MEGLGFINKTANAWDGVLIYVMPDHFPNPDDTRILQKNGMSEQGQLHQ